MKFRWRTYSHEPQSSIYSLFEMGTGVKTLVIVCGTCAGAALGFYLQEKLMEDYREQQRVGFVRSLLKRLSTQAPQAAPRDLGDRSYEIIEKKISKPT